MSLAQAVDVRVGRRQYSTSWRDSKREELIVDTDPSSCQDSCAHAAATCGSISSAAGAAVSAVPHARGASDDPFSPSRLSVTDTITSTTSRHDSGMLLHVAQRHHYGVERYAGDSLDMPSNIAPLPARRNHGAEQVGGGAGKGWREGIGSFARVLALSAVPQSRKLLEDRKPPFAHLTPRRLAFTFVKSGLVVAAPLANEVVLENLDDWDEAPSRPSSDRPGSRIFLNDEGRLVRVDEEEDGKDDDIMQQLAKSFRFFPSMTARRIVHSVMAVSTQRLLEWQAVMHLTARKADRLTKNIGLSALRKTDRMSRTLAARKMALTAAKALCFQNLAVFLVDELFVAITLGLRERTRRKNNPYTSTHWSALLREMRTKTAGNATYALGVWLAGTLGAMAGTLVYPERGPDMFCALFEIGASTILN